MVLVYTIDICCVMLILKVRTKIDSAKPQIRRIAFEGWHE